MFERLLPVKEDVEVYVPWSFVDDFVTSHVIFDSLELVQEVQRF